MTQRLADGDVALDGHASEVDGCVSGGEDRQQDGEAAHGHIDLVENVAEDANHGGGGQLDGVIDDHVDEEDVTRIFIESLEEVRM